MKMINAYTMELDDAAIAVDEILEQLDLEHSMGTHAAGFITCSYDFVEAGLIGPICEALPFEVVGCTTLLNATNQDASPMQLCATMLTGDDCSFATVFSEPLAADSLKDNMAALWARGAAALGGPPKLAIVFIPMVMDLSGETILAALDAASGGVPTFGTIATDHSTGDYEDTRTFCGGAAARDRLSLLMIGGAVEPRFLSIYTTGQNAMLQKARVTLAEGSLMKEIDGAPARDYLMDMGLTKGQDVVGLTCVPFLVDFGDGTPPATRAIYSINAEGHALMGGDLPSGSTLAIGTLDPGEVQTTAKTLAAAALELEGLAGLVFFPCIGRNMVLGADLLAEARVIDQVIANRVPWHLAYSGGEVCPVYRENGQPTNRFHNFTLVALAF